MIGVLKISITQIHGVSLHIDLQHGFATRCHVAYILSLRLVAKMCDCDLRRYFIYFRVLNIWNSFPEFAIAYLPKRLIV